MKMLLHVSQWLPLSLSVSLFSLSLSLASAFCLLSLFLFLTVISQKSLYSFIPDTYSFFPSFPSLPFLYSHCLIVSPLTLFSINLSLFSLLNHTLSPFLSSSSLCPPFFFLSFTLLLFYCLISPHPHPAPPRLSLPYSSSPCSFLFSSFCLFPAISLFISISFSLFVRFSIITISDVGGLIVIPPNQSWLWVWWEWGGGTGARLVYKTRVRAQGSPCRSSRGVSLFGAARGRLASVRREYGSSGEPMVPEISNTHALSGRAPSILHKVT